MIHTLIGAEAFRRGSDLYFERFDGQAVTTDDFVACMAEASGTDFTQFKRWYSQAGTPRVKVTGQFDSGSGEYRLTFSQSCPPTPGQEVKEPWVIPMKMGLLDGQGRDMPIETDGDYNPETQVLTLTEAETSVSFRNLGESPVPSLLRDFSAPVRLYFNYRDEELAFLATKDTNGFNRWDAIQQLYLNSILSMAAEIRDGKSPGVSKSLLDAVSAIAGDAGLSPAIRTAMLKLPGYAILKDAVDEVHIESLVAARKAVISAVASRYRDIWRSLTERLAGKGEYQFNADEAGRRSLQGLSLWYWVKAGDQSAYDYADELYRRATNQTDRGNALQAAMAGEDHSLQDELLGHFYEQWKGDTQMVEQWLSLQASAPGAKPSDIEKLMQHTAFDLKNPNKVRSVIGGFARNTEAFHDEAGEGYQVVSKVIGQLNAINPQIAARLVTLFSDWKRFEPGRRAMMETALKNILATPNLSSDVFEMAQRALKD